MKRATLCAEINTYTGYGQHALRIFSTLEDAGYYVSIRPLKVSDAFGAIVPVKVRSRFVGTVQPEPWEILLSHPRATCTPGKRTAYFTMWESTKLPREKVELLNQAECVIVPSVWQASCFSACGVKSRMAVVRLGVDPAIFSPRPVPSGDMVFGTAGRLANGPARKGVADVIRWFGKAFPKQKDVRLRVKVFPDCVLPAINDPRIEVNQAWWTGAKLADWYGSLSCFVSGARGEGWGLMQHEAMAMGRPVIGSIFGGLTEFMNGQNSFAVRYRLEPAGEGYTGCGYWAEPDEDAAIEALREAYEKPEQTGAMGARAAQAVAGLTWEAHNRALLEVLAEAGAVKKPLVSSGVIGPARDLTVAITSYQRAKHLDRAIGSAAPVAQHIAIAAMEPTAEVESVLGKWQETLGNRLRVARLPVDLGCNELWLQAVYRSPTERVIVLHDDDFLDQRLAWVYAETIAPFLDAGGGFVSWRGHVVWDGGEVRPIEWFHGETRMLAGREMLAFVGQRGRLSLSPVISVLRRSVLLDALKEAQQCLIANECLLRPGMLLGTEILAYLRHGQAFPSWLYVNEVLSYYGAHEGSGTVQAEKAGNLQPLIAGYDFARTHFEQHRDHQPALPARLLLVSSEYVPTTPDEERRLGQARTTWEFHFNQGTMLDFPVREAELPRSSAHLGDPRPVPYFRDLVTHALGFARPEDIIVYANRDLCLTTLAAERVSAAVRANHGIAVAVRRNWPYPCPAGLRRSVMNCQPDGGFDLFAFTPAWWETHGGKMPDMLIGREAWDTVLRTIAEESGAGEAVYADDICYHENHGSYWITERRSNPGQVHNRQLGVKFFQARPQNPKSSYILKQLTS